MTELSSPQQKFVSHWGEMGARWGVNRTVAQIHALLYLSPSPLTAEEIATTLSVARSNVSTSLKTLQTWDLVSVVHVLGDRCDRYDSIKDVWELFRIVLEARKRREVDPTVAMLHECLDEMKQADGDDLYTRQRLEEMLGFFDVMTEAYEHVRNTPSDRLQKLIKMGGKMQKFLFG